MSRRAPPGRPTGRSSRSRLPAAGGRRRDSPVAPRRRVAFSGRNLGIGAAAIGLLLVAALLFHGRGGGEIANLATADGPGGIAVLGDSLAAGTGAKPEESFPARLGASLGCRVVNAGVPGNTSGDGLGRVASVLETRPRIVVVELGGNDFLRKLDRKETEQNLDRILAEVVRSGAIPVLLGIELGVFVDEYGELYARLAKKHRAFYVPDLLGGVLGKPELMSDAIHPNAEGYRRIADRLDRELRRLLSRAGHPCG